MGISIVSYLLTRYNQINHSTIAAHVTPFNRAFAEPAAQALSPYTAAGRAALDQMIQGQAAVISYINDFKLLMIMSLIARFPLFVWAGAGLLGWIGGEMIVTDPWIVARLGHGAGEWHLIGASVGAALVLAIAWTLRRSRRAQRPV